MNRPGSPRSGDRGPDVPSKLAVGVLRRLEELGVELDRPEPLVVAVSGGLDSCVLLHALRFTGALGTRLVVAHLDHAMRPESAADARWMAGLCTAWDVPLHASRLKTTPTSEDTARTLRYDFLERVRGETGACAIITAHHADDQAETVLFRVLRGTGVDGLRGIPAARAPGILRPMLGVWRPEIEAYAKAHHVSCRPDATNDAPGFARNVIRHRLLPEAERTVAPGARAALVRLAAHAEAEGEAWAEVMQRELEQLDLVRRPSPEGEEVRLPAGCSVDRRGLAERGPALRARILRHLAAGLGATLGAAATDRAVTFVDRGRSGSRIELGAGVQLRRELGRIHLDRSGPVDAPIEDGAGRAGVGETPVSERVVLIERADSGSADGRIGGADVRVTWDTHTVPPPDAGAGVADWPPEPADPPGAELSLPVDAVVFPLTVRGRVPGDRIRLAAGSRKVKKLLLEAGVPSDARDRLAVIVDGLDRVLWVQGIARSVDATPPAAGRRLVVRVEPLSEPRGATGRRARGPWSRSRTGARR